MLLHLDIFKPQIYKKYIWNLPIWRRFWFKKDAEISNFAIRKYFFHHK